MDQHLLPALAHVLSSIPSRRDVLRGLAGTGLGLAALRTPDTGEAKKRKHKKNKPCPPCKKRKKGKCKGALPDGTPCPDGACQRGACQPTDPCPGQRSCEGACIPTDQCCTQEDCPATGGLFCCDGLCTNEKQDAGSDCNQASECCSNYCRTTSVGLKRCAITCRGKECSLDSECCRGFSCASGHCGRCFDSGEGCASGADCCFSACTTNPGTTYKTCGSYPGGPCEKNFDCQSCRAYHDCIVTTPNHSLDVCQNGICGCPYDCCADADCFPAEFCAVDQYGLRGECMLRTQPRRRGLN
jgi:hypothetical protein